MGKKYIGQDISERHVRESNQILDFLHKYGIKFDAKVIQKNILDSNGSYPCLFTCPPSGIEVYENVPIDTRTCDDWIDECLNRFKCQRYIFIVNNTKKYKDNVIDTIFIKYSLRNNKKYIIIIDRV